MNLKKQLWNLIITALFLLAVLVFSISALFPLAFGWFSENRKVNADLGGVGAKSNYDVTQTFGAKLVKGFSGAEQELTLENGEFTFSSLMPGDRIVLYTTMTNNEDYSLVCDFFLFDKDGKEMPIVIGGGKYFLSTQLKIIEYKIQKGGGALVTQTVGDYLFSPADFTYENGLPSTNATETGALPTKILNILQNQTLAPDETVYFEVTVEFVKSAINQNVYKNFGAEGNSYCSRQLAVHFKNANE